MFAFLILALVHGPSMPLQDLPFHELFGHVRQGDQESITELVRRYEPEIRRAVRVRLTDPRIRRTIDSLDVCQSVLANFFVRISLGEFDLKRSEDLVALLVTMVRNKLVDQTRRLQADRRDARRVTFGDSTLDAIPTRSASPDEQAADRDLLAEVRRRLSDEERYLAEQRAIGCDWSELAQQLNSTPDALRKKLSRAIDRVTLELEQGAPRDA